MMFFLILSNAGPIVLLIVASPSSFYNPKLSFSSNLDNLFRRQRLTNSQIPVTSKLSILTSNCSLPLFLIHVPSLLKISDLCASFAALMPFSSIVVNDLAQLINFFSRSCETDG